eukprot:726727-Rhodomonas_salina.5
MSGRKSRRSRTKVEMVSSQEAAMRHQKQTQESSVPDKAGKQHAGRNCSRACKRKVLSLAHEDAARRS